MTEYYHHKLVLKYLRTRHRCGHIKAELTRFAIYPQMFVLFESSPEFIRKNLQPKIAIFLLVTRETYAITKQTFLIMMTYFHGNKTIFRESRRLK